MTPRLPARMSLFEVERRAARLRHRLLAATGAIILAVFATGMVAIWRQDGRWVETTAWLVVLGAAVFGVYLVVNTPQVVPRLAEHFRTRGVEIDDKGQP